MQAYLVTFYTQQDRIHANMPLANWIFAQAEKLDLEGATMTAAIAGRGHDKKQHAINMFDLSEQPVQISMVLREEEMHRLFEHLKKERVKVFYTTAQVDCGMLGE